MKRQGEAHNFEWRVCDSKVVFGKAQGSTVSRRSRPCLHASMTKESWVREFKTVIVYCTQVRTHLGVIQPRSRPNACALRNMGRGSRIRSGPILYADVCCNGFSLVSMQPPFQGGMLLGTA